jgi:hypothetical protein
MATSIDLLSQSSDMSSVRPSLFNSMKLECPDDLVHLSSDYSEGTISNVSLPTPVAHTLVSNSKCNEHSKFVFNPIGSSGHSNLARPPSTPILENVPMSYNALDAWPQSLDPETNWLQLTMTRLLITKYNTFYLRIMAMLFLSCHQFKSPLLLLRTLWMVWISGLMVTHGAVP